MKKEARTAAELQIEALRQLKQTQPRRKALPAPAAKPAAPTTPQAPWVSGFELSESTAPRPRKRSGPQLPLSASQWVRLRERQREHHEFRLRRDMGDWAAELLLALPPGVHALSAEAKAELFKRMHDWAAARGTR